MKGQNDPTVFSTVVESKAQIPRFAVMRSLFGHLGTRIQEKGPQVAVTGLPRALEKWSLQLEVPHQHWHVLKQCLEHFLYMAA